MGLLKFRARDQAQHFRNGLKTTEKNHATIVDKPTVKAKLIITPLDSYRRELFASYPLGEGQLARESIDECKHF